MMGGGGLVMVGEDENSAMMQKIDGVTHTLVREREY
jgi:hypothetical protein